MDPNEDRAAHEEMINKMNEHIKWLEAFKKNGEPGTDVARSASYLLREEVHMYMMDAGHTYMGGELGAKFLDIVRRLKKFGGRLP